MSAWEEERQIAKKVFIPATIDTEVTIEERYIIVNGKGEMVDSLIFDNPIEADAWLEVKYPKADYEM
ncbi:hypothetical protein [Burkholderia glumae]|uniref:hypothetical protein n=1 Tax=Burkholderia glumae TaxID=337 RepID=UPI001463D6BC|nr:hypothetical protein [Burkholderia glumae]QJP72076.1 hypothetical protein HJC54_18140 [Burkholderia glumae]